MKMINDKNEPDLYAILDNKIELSQIKNQVDNLNSDLTDSGFDKYQYKVEVRGRKAYIRLVYIYAWLL